MWQRFKLWLIRFMQGRYGVDNLNKFLLVMYIAVLLFNTILTAILRSPVVYYILYALTIAALIFSIYRMFSRDIERRQRENQIYLDTKRKVKQFFKRQINRVKEIRTHRYRKCPHCKVVLRLPKKVGDVNVRCPKCRNDFTVKIRF